MFREQNIGKAAEELRGLAQQQSDQVIVFSYSNKPIPSKPRLDRISETMWHLGLVPAGKSADMVTLETFKLFGEFPLRRHEKGNTLAFVGDKIDYLMFVREGSVFTYHIDPYNDKRTIAEILDAPSLIGEEALLWPERNRERYRYSVECYSDCQVNFMRPSEMSELFQQHPDVYKFLWIIQAMRLQSIRERTERRLHISTTQNAEQIITSNLLELAERPYLPKGLTHEFLGQLTGYTRERVWEVVTSFRERGVVVWGRKGLEILHVGRAKKIVEGRVV